MNVKIVSFVLTTLHYLRWLCGLI